MVKCKKQTVKLKKDPTEHKTLSSFYKFNKDEHKVLKVLSKGTKNAYNHYLFCINLYYLFKSNIFESIYLGILKKEIDINNINENIQSKFKQYYDFYSDNYDLIKNNNNLIYNFIKNKQIFITDYNYDFNLKYF